MTDSFSKQLEQIQDQIDVLGQILSGIFDRMNGNYQAIEGHISGIEGHISGIRGDYSLMNSAAERIADGQRELRPRPTSPGPELRRNPFSE